MLFAIVFAHLWGVFQLIALASLTRTISLRTVLVTVCVGFYACAPVALLAQIAWIYPVAWLTGESTYDLIRIASYTLDPFIEEAVKVLPLALLLTIPTIRTQLSLTDCVLIGAAAGSGFGLAEDLYRCGHAAGAANSIETGWILGTSLALPEVPGLGTTLTSWLPPGVTAGDVFFPGERGRPWVNIHLAWSAVGGLAVGLYTFHRISFGRKLAAALLLYIGFDHASWNATGSWYEPLIQLPLFVALREWVVVLPFAALMLAWWLDRGRLRANDRADIPLLGAERSASSRFAGTLQAATSRLPWSLAQVFSYVRMRRAYLLSLSGQSGETSLALRRRADAARDRIDHSPLTHAPVSRWPTNQWLTTIRQPSIVLLTVLLIPSLLWFFAGASSLTTRLQALMTGPKAWILVLVFSTAILSWLLLQLIGAIRSWPQTLRTSLGDEAAFMNLKIAFGIGAVGLGGYALLHSFSGLSPTSSLFGAHVLDAFRDLSTAATLMFMGPALAVFSTGGGMLGGGTIAEGMPFAWGPAEAAIPEVAAPAAAAGLAATGVAAAGVATGVLGPLGYGYARDHMAELDDLPDPDELSRPGGLPDSTPPVYPDAPTIPTPGQPAPTWPAPPGNPPPSFGPDDPYPYPGADPLNPLIPGPPGIPDPPPGYDKTAPNAPPKPATPPDFQHGSPTKPAPGNPHVAPDPNAPRKPPPKGPYR